MSDTGIHVTDPAHRADCTLVKEYEGHQIYVTSEGKFLAATKDKHGYHMVVGGSTLRALEKKLGPPSTIVKAMRLRTGYGDNYQAIEIVEYVKRTEQYRKRDGDLIGGWREKLYLYDQQLLDEMKALEQERRQLDDRARAIQDQAIRLEPEHLKAKPEEPT